MLASELIAKLQELVDEHGDLEVKLIDYDYGDVDVVYVGRDTDPDSYDEKQLDMHFSISA